MPASREFLRRLLVPFILAILGAALCAWLVPAEKLAVAEQLKGFPDSDVSAHMARISVLAGMCFLPALAGLCYAAGGTLARYMAREFMGILAICFAALFTIWLLQDLQNNLTDLRGGDDLMKTLLTFYGTRAPFIIRELLPYSLLLALLFCLGKLSKSREIVAMIQTGHGLPRIVMPLILGGIFCAALCTGLNYHWAPIAEGSSDEILQEARGSMISVASNVLYRNPSKHRLWMVQTFPKNYQKGEPLQNVEVTTSRDDKKLVSRLIAEKARWDLKDRSWSFFKGHIETFVPDQPLKPPSFQNSTEMVFSCHSRPSWLLMPKTRLVFKPLVILGMTETPQQLIKPGLAAPFLGIPELNGWLIANQGNELTLNPAPYLTQWHYRWAQPMICLVTVLLAAPLGIHFSRRGSTGGVAMAVALSGGLLFLTTVSLALGEAGKLAPPLAAWLPNMFFALLGMFLFHRRMAGRPIYQSLLKLLPGGD